METKHNYFTIRAKLPSLNEYIKACNSHRYEGGKFKAEVEEVIGWAIRQAVCERTLRPTTKPVRVYFEWHESTKRRDADNIASAKKFILDALQTHGIIPNDNRKFVKGFGDQIVDDKENFVFVQIFEVEEAEKPQIKRK